MLAWLHVHDTRIVLQEHNDGRHAGAHCHTLPTVDADDRSGLAGDANDAPMPGRAAFRRSRPVAVATAGCVLVILLGAWWAVSGAPREATKPSGGVGFGCGFLGTPAPATGCPLPDEAQLRRGVLDDRLLAADESRRSALSPQAKIAQGTLDDVRMAAAFGGWCPTLSDQSCGAPAPSPHPPTQADLEQARLWLNRTGASATVARFARPEDPAPPGSVVYAARFGAACVVSYVVTVPNFNGPIRVVGLLPDGSCLPA
ncbi:hypothetical protein DFJ67_6986 [Asanoa ferruginea]|uniref:Uncharacterized protein n=1 Tax=Asanoa ferruginea TaxID=53367 RepID=A0A3D9ZWE5_9ACTN|nr:hypothetical protein DFJ67_6986 [Asanoa ferruginea]GIF47509.1 hypothetical protein Afe04nite_20480 [Asanoa ferruginea]